MNQQLIFNNDFTYSEEQSAVTFSCLVSGLKVWCFIANSKYIADDEFLTQVKADAFTWEDKAEDAIENEAYNDKGEIWL